MKYFYLTFFLIFLLQKSYSFVLTSVNPARFPSGTISIKVNTTACSNVTESYTEIEALIKEAVEDYWNQVYTSSINFKVDGNITVTNHKDNLFAAADDTVTVGCHDIGNSSTFAAASLGCNTLNGVCINAMGVMYINDNTNSPWLSAARDTKVAILAHELGHTIGIGHSDKSYALMYYATNSSDIQYYLSEDDADAVTFLYPDDPQLLGLGGNCGAVASTPGKKGGPSSPLSSLLGLLMGAFLIFLIRKFLKNFHKQET